MKSPNIFSKVFNYIKNLLKELNSKNLTINIMVDDEVIGSVQTICMKGSDSESEPKAILYRTRFNKDQLYESFNKGFVTASSQRKPFQIIIGNRFNNIKLNNCWVISTLYSYVSGDILIIDTMEIKYENRESKTK